MFTRRTEPDLLQSLKAAREDKNHIYSSLVATINSARSNGVKFKESETSDLTSDVFKFT